MCGILFISNNDFSQEICNNALNLMSHRGPDNSSFKIIKDNFLGHVRLSIIDLNERSNQPFEFNNKTIVFNGEIYNYKDLIKEHNLVVNTNSDTEVLIRMYDKYGAKCLKFLNGMFSFVIYDKLKNSFFVARDRLGIKPLYYRKINNSYIFSSEISPILYLKGDDFDEFGIRQYRKLRMTIKNDTLYQNIKMFPPGTYFDGNYFNKYWELEIFDKAPPDDVELEFLIRDSIRLRKISDVPLGSYLSGGLDSTVLSILLSPEHTWTVGFENLNEFNWANIANSKLQSKHHQILINKEEFLDFAEMMIKKRKEPLSVPNEVLIYKMTKRVKKFNTVVISGEGADELFWGYDRIFKYVKTLNNKISIENFDKYYCYGSNKDDEVIDYALEGINYKNPIDHIAYYFQIIHLQGLLRRLDNSTMLCSVEARVPFVDHRLVELLAGSPFEWRMGDSFKEPLKRIFNKITPDEIINRKKIGFPVPLKDIFPKYDHINTPMDNWLNFNLNKLLNE